MVATDRPKFLGNEIKKIFPDRKHTTFFSTPDYTNRNDAETRIDKEPVAIFTFLMADEKKGRSNFKKSPSRVKS